MGRGCRSCIHGRFIEYEGLVRIVCQSDLSTLTALQIYPPMGNRRFKYYQVSSLQSRGSENLSSKSYGRCQLIQLYIHQKTGKMRTRKQISSHLQKLKKTNNSNSLSLYSIKGLTRLISHINVGSVALALTQDEPVSPTALGASAVLNQPSKNFNSALLNHGNSVSAISFPSNSEAASLFPVSAVPENLDSIHKHPNGFYRTVLLEPRLVHVADASPQFDKNLKSYYNNQSRSEDRGIFNPDSCDFDVNDTSDLSPSANAHSMMRRRPESNIPVSHSQSLSPSAAQPSYGIVLPRAFLDKYGAPTISYAAPLTPVEQLLHTPLQPPEILRPDKKNEITKAHENKKGWLWPSVDSSFHQLQSPLDSFLPGTSTARPLVLDHFPGSADIRRLSTHSPQAHSRVPLRLPRKLSYSYPPTLTSSPPTFKIFSVPSIPPAIPPSRISNVEPFSSKSLASPLDIKRFVSATDPDKQFLNTTVGSMELSSITT